MGWYHSHPFDVEVHSHCFLSSTDISTQLSWQRAEDPHGNPWLAIVVRCRFNAFAFVSVYRYSCSHFIMLLVQAGLTQTVPSIHPTRARERFYNCEVAVVLLLRLGRGHSSTRCILSKRGQRTKNEDGNEQSSLEIQAVRDMKGDDGKVVYEPTPAAPGDVRASDPPTTRSGKRRQAGHLDVVGRGRVTQSTMNFVRLSAGFPRS